jgi:hypothetical protein
MKPILEGFPVTYSREFGDDVVNGLYDCKPRRTANLIGPCPRHSLIVSISLIRLSTQAHPMEAPRYNVYSSPKFLRANHLDISSVCNYGWTVMRRFGFIPSELNGPGIHRLENVLTLDNTVHRAFAALDLWFKPTVSIQILCESPFSLVLDVCGTNPTSTHFNLQHLASFAHITRFPLPDPEKLPLLSSEYIRIHVACAKVAH